MNDEYKVLELQTKVKKLEDLVFQLLSSNSKNEVKIDALYRALEGVIK